jgi:hypothetical protein
MPYGGHPDTDLNDRIRFLVGDTDPLNPLFTDYEIAYVRATWGDDEYVCAAALAEQLAGRYAGRVSQTVGRVSVSYSDLAKQYLALAASLRARTAMTAKPYAGGISLADMETDDEDDDRPAPAFDIGRDDNPGASTDALKSE